MGFYGIDYWYIILVVPALLISLAAQVFVKSAFNKQSKIRNNRGITGAYAAQCVLMNNGITDVTIVRCKGNLTDNYNPTNKVLSLSESVYGSASVAAVGIACHEAGHAVQHAKNYFPNKVRSSLVPVCNVGSKLSLPLIIIGILLSFETLVYAGIILYSLITLFQLVTLPVEFDASHRAIKAIEGYGMLGDDELPGAKKVLTAAALTYVAALITSFANLLRLVLRYSGRRR